MNDLDEALVALMGSTAPLLIGVRHHSPTCAAAIPTLMAAMKPDRLCIEMPHELSQWLPHLMHEDTHGPVALSLVDGDGSVGFWPFADFSPEMVALKTARIMNIPVVAFDCFVPDVERTSSPQGAALSQRLQHNSHAHDDDDVWEHLIEAGVDGATAEQVRRAGLAFGHGLRMAATKESSVRDRIREQHMRTLLAEQSKEGARVLCVVGAFHAAALLSEHDRQQHDPLYGHVSTSTQHNTTTQASALVPYAYPLLDARSSYPAGITDPAWRERVFHAATANTGMAALVSQTAVDIVRAMRSTGHNASTADAVEVVRMANDLASLRHKRSPSRRELLEAIDTVVVQGGALGRGRVVAAALEQVMVGKRQGQLSTTTPRSGLLVAVEARLSALSLPALSDPTPKPIRLDPLNSHVDGDRHRLLSQLLLCSVPYAQRTDRGTHRNAFTVTSAWRIEGSPAAIATLSFAALYGPTPAAAAAGLVAERLRRADVDADDDQAMAVTEQLVLVEHAAAAGLAAIVAAQLSSWDLKLLPRASVAEVLAVRTFTERLRAHHEPGLSDNDNLVIAPALAKLDDHTLVHAGLRAFEGCLGSTEDADALAMAELSTLVVSTDVERLRFVAMLNAARTTASPLLAGAAVVLLERDYDQGAEVGASLSSLLDVDAAVLGATLRGALLVGASYLEAAVSPWQHMTARIDAYSDDEFLPRLPSLRHAFEALSPAARERLLEVLEDRLDADRRDVTDHLVDDPAHLARCAAIDSAARARLEALGLSLLSKPSPSPSTATTTATTAITHSRVHGLSILDRWRLILADRKPASSDLSQRAKRSLDALYGHGEGEGSYDLGGHEDGVVTGRDWHLELEALFGARVRQDVLAVAAARGVPGAVLGLDVDSITPSVSLLEAVLSHKGGLAEGELQRLRSLCRRIVDDLVKQLAVRVKPALSGMHLARTTRRRTGSLDVRSTVRANLSKAQLVNGKPQVIAEHVLFRARGQRSLDWHLILVVDLSGSMDTSVLYSAMMAAILHGLPALTVRFIGFDTRVVDFSDHVADPLSLLLEMKVGGGTDIGKALRYARSLITVPKRTVVVVVTDFEEGGSLSRLLDEVKALVDSGVTTLGLAALDDNATPRFHHGIAEHVTALGMPVAALSPLELAQFVADKIRS